jgi:hypothetical protein
MAFYRFLIRRILTLPLDREQQHGEWQQILHIAHNNNFPTNLLTWLNSEYNRAYLIRNPPPPHP